MTNTIHQKEKKDSHFGIRVSGQFLARLSAIAVRISHRDSVKYSNGEVARIAMEIGFGVLERELSGYSIQKCHTLPTTEAARKYAIEAFEAGLKHLANG